MSTSAIVVMIIGMIVIWGGLIGSIANAVSKSKKKRMK